MTLNRKPLLPLLLFVSLLTAADQTAGCNRSCGNTKVPFPFGFSSGCPIRLTCTNQTALLTTYPIKPDSITPSGTIKISVKPQCNRSVSALRGLFAKHYAPTGHNAVLFHDCEGATSCDIPLIDVQTRFDTLQCNSTNISCFANGTRDGFFDYERVINSSRCKYLLSSIMAHSFDDSAPGMSLEIQVMELAWWLPGGECACSEGANCAHVNTTAGVGAGYRCQCRDGMIGGYLAGEGCREECDIAKYLSGKCRGATRIAVFIGGIAVCTALLIALVLVCCLVWRRFKSKTKTYSKRKLKETSGIIIPIYAYKEIERATNGFSDKQRLGTGAYGTVYSGKLNNDLWVAIKRIKHRDMENTEQVTNEIKLISSVSHPNLVRLLGCSIENGEQILVYEFMPNGTLCQHLQRERGDGLSWHVRLAIAAETAQAIAYLHSAIDPPIYHRDVKSSNILLDYNFRSKVADFGLSRLGRTEMSHISTAPQGTPGYLDPQYHQDFHLSDKSDVYSFGVVLVEILTAFRVVDFSRPQNETNLAALATDRIAKGKLIEIIDPVIDLHTDAWTLSAVHKVAELAFRCLAYHRDMRPSMTEVAAELERIRLIKWSTSEETICLTSSAEESTSSSSSNVSEKPLSLEIRKAETGDTEEAPSSLSSMDMAKENSPGSVQDPYWLNEQTSPSSSCLLSNVVRQF